MRTLVVSPSSLNTFQLCARRFNYEKNARLSLSVTPARFDKGTLIHFMLEEYYKGRIVGGTVLPTEEIVQLALQKSLGMDIMPADVQNVIKTFRYYVQHGPYKNESWRPIAVEAAFSRVLYESDDLRILFEGKADLIVETNTRFVVDHKSMDRFSQPPFLSNQMQGYCWAFDLSNAVYNRMKIPAEDKDDLSRVTVSYTKEQIEEWKHSAIYWAIMMDQSLQNEAFPPNNTSCDKWGKCPFQRICNASESVRASIIQREYKILPPHDLFAVKDDKAKEQTS